LPLHEWTLVAALVLLPPVVIVVSMYTTHAFIERYMLWVVIGFALLGAAGLSAAVRGRAAVGVALIGIAMASIARLEVGPLLETPVLRTAEGMRQELDKIARDDSELIVVANAHAFMELSYYLDPPLRERLVFPLSRELDLQYRGFDTDALTLGPLGQRGQVPVKAYDEILAENQRFLLAATQHDYLAQHLASSGYDVTPIPGTTMLYRVQAPDE
jgi:signal transduction histidine kinase